MTELIWDGKYDAQGRKVAPPRIGLWSERRGRSPRHDGIRAREGHRLAMGQAYDTIEQLDVDARRTIHGSIQR